MDLGFRQGGFFWLHYYICGLEQAFSQRSSSAKWAEGLAMFGLGSCQRILLSKLMMEGWSAS